MAVLSEGKRTVSPPSDITLAAIHTICELFSADDGGFLRSTFAHIDEDDNVFFGETPVRKLKVPKQDLHRLLSLVDDEDIYPLWDTTLTICPSVDTDRHFIKRPKLSHYSPSEEEKVCLPELLLEEARTLERLTAFGHPNIVKYHGCSVKYERITGLVLDRLPETLEQRLRDDKRPPLDKDKSLRQVITAIEYLHSLGLAHNDLNPSNVMLDRNDKAVLIDFGSCKPFGHSLITAGTPGWVEDEDFTTSEKEHDLFALEKLAVWLKDPPDT